jgi:hypothetical protein
MFRVAGVDEKQRPLIRVVQAGAGDYRSGRYLQRPIPAAPITAAADNAYTGYTDNR